MHVEPNPQKQAITGAASLLRGAEEYLANAVDSLRDAGLGPDAIRVLRTSRRVADIRQDLEKRSF